MEQADPRRPDQAPGGPFGADDVVAFWARALMATGEDPATPLPPVWSFGDSPELADGLVELVLSGRKRATASAVASYEHDRQPLPAVGERSIVTDGAGRARVVLETTEIRIGPLHSVDDRFAWDEGEGDRTRAGWLDEHTRFFTRSLADIGLEFDPDMLVVFERFEVRYREPDT